MEPQDIFTASRNYEGSGPITVSDLNRSVPNSSSGKRRKDFKRQKAHHDKMATETFATEQQEPTEQSTIEEPILNRLRSRLDPTYNIANAPTHAGDALVNSDSLPESGTPAVDKPVKRGKKKRREKSRSTDNNDQPTTTSETQLANSTTQVPAEVTGGQYSIFSILHRIHTCKLSVECVALKYLCCSKCCCIRLFCTHAYHTIQK